LAKEEGEKGWRREGTVGNQENEKRQILIRGGG